MVKGEKNTVYTDEMRKTRNRIAHKSLETAGLVGSAKNLRKKGPGEKKPNAGVGAQKGSGKVLVKKMKRTIDNGES